MENTIAQLSEVVKAGTMLTAEIDLKTHTRWIRDWDPLNIYRYSDLIYNIFKFPGALNRLRPVEYRKILEKYGWGNITTTPLVVLEKGYLSRVVPSLIRRFRDPLNQMDYLSIMLLATRK